jgi:anti-sigma factor ChrR (cupin superfamily)
MSQPLDQPPPPGSLVLALAQALAPEAAGAFQPMRPGVEIRSLYDRGPEGPAAALLRYAPGASVPAHLHQGFEHVLILEGEQRDERGRYPAGTLVVNPPGSRHSVHSPTGCVALLIWERPVRFLP